MPIELELFTLLSLHQHLKSHAWDDKRMVVKGAVQLDDDLTGYQGATSKSH